MVSAKPSFGNREPVVAIAVCQRRCGNQLVSVGVALVEVSASFPRDGGVTMALFAKLVFSGVCGFAVIQIGVIDDICDAVIVSFR